MHVVGRQVDISQASFLAAYDHAGLNLGQVQLGGSMIVPKPKLPLRTQSVRDLAITRLEELVVVLRDANDIGAAEMVQQTIRQLRGEEVFQTRGSEFWRRAGDGLSRASSSATASARAASEAAAATVRSGAARAAKGAVLAGSAAEKGAELVRSTAGSAAAGFGVAHLSLSGFAHNVDWSNLPYEYLTKFVTAGTRGIDRSLGEARLVWETIPQQIRALGTEEVAMRLDGFDWSHIIAHSKGGSNDASNGIFELASLNRSRGAEQMTPSEIHAAQQVLSSQAFQAALVEVAFQAFKGAVAGAVIACVIATLEHGLGYQRGEISREEMYRRIGKSAMLGAGAGAATSGVMVMVALAFPALIPLALPLMLPFAVLGFCAVGGRIVLAAKGWHELLQDVYELRLPGVFPVALPPPEEIPNSV